MRQRWATRARGRGYLWDHAIRVHAGDAGYACVVHLERVDHGARDEERADRALRRLGRRRRRGTGKLRDGRNLGDDDECVGLVHRREEEGEAHRLRHGGLRLGRGAGA